MTGSLLPFEKKKLCTKALRPSLARRPARAAKVRNDAAKKQTKTKQKNEKANCKRPPRVRYTFYAKKMQAHPQRLTQAAFLRAKIKPAKPSFERRWREAPEDRVARRATISVQKNRKKNPGKWIRDFLRLGALHYMSSHSETGSAPLAARSCERQILRSRAPRRFFFLTIFY